MKDNLILNKRKTIQTLQDILIHNNEKYDIKGDGKHIVHTKEFALKHTFADGIYVRQMNMDKGSAVIGAIHNHLHVWFLLTGHLIVATENTTEENIAPCYKLAKPGSKRVIYAVEDSIFVNIHKNPNNNENLDELESEIVSLNFEDYEEYIKNK